MGQTEWIAPTEITGSYTFHGLLDYRLEPDKNPRPTLDHVRLLDGAQQNRKREALEAAHASFRAKRSVFLAAAAGFKATSAQSYGITSMRQSV